MDNMDRLQTPLTTSGKRWVGVNPDIIRSLIGQIPKSRHQDPPILQNADGSFYIRPWVDILTAAGRQRKKKTFNLGTSKREAVTKKREIMTTVNNSGGVIRSQVPFAQLLANYQDLHIKKLGRATQLLYGGLLTNHIEPRWAGSMLCEITTIEIQRWFDGMQLAPTTKYVIRSILHHIFKKAIAWNLWNERNPVEGVDLDRKILKREKRKLTIEQTRAIMAGLPAVPRLVVKTALFGTLRISEVLALQEKHLDLEHKTIHVRQRLYRGDIDTTKTRNSTRDVAVGTLMDELQTLCHGDPDRYIFRSSPECRNDGYIREKYLRPAAEKLNLYWQGFGFHTFRREAITRYASFDPAQAMKMAGHGSLDMTALYTLSDHREQERLVEKFYREISQTEPRDR